MELSYQFVLSGKKISLGRLPCMRFYDILTYHTKHTFLCVKNRHGRVERLCSGKDYLRLSSQLKNLTG